MEFSVTKKNVHIVLTAASLLAGSAKSEHVSCCYCDQNHSAAHFKTETDIDVKRDILTKSGRCFVCLRRGHKAKECRSPHKCSACGRKHHVSVPNTSAGALTLLWHEDKKNHQLHPKTTVAPSLVIASQSSQLSDKSMFVHTRTPVFLQTARTAVYNPDTPMVTRILFDAVNTFGTETGRPQKCALVNLCVKVKRGVNITVPLRTVPTVCKPR